MEAANTETTAPEIPPSLDSLETSIDSSLPTCYSDVRFSKHRDELKAAIETYTALDEGTRRERTYELLECRKYAWFTRHKETGKVKVVANSCRLRWCPVCAEAKQLRIRDAVSKWLRSVTKPRFITLTCSHSANGLDVQIQHLYKSFRLLRTHKGITRKIRGGIWFFQLKLGKRDHCWHPHLHVLVDSDYINQKELSLEWMATTGNSFIVDIRAVKDPGKVADYVSRYCAKPCRMSDFEEDNRHTIATVLHGKRLCGAFGSGRKCSFKTTRPEDFAKWQRLGLWHNIIPNRFYNDLYRRIVKCWSTGDSMPLEDCQGLISESNPPELPTNEPKRAVSTNQLFFEEFVRR